jgi:hypothetical protein
MGINLVVIVENRNHLSLAEFRSALLQDQEIGHLAWDTYWDTYWETTERGKTVAEEDRFYAWQEFIWEGKQYFTWMTSPRMSSFNAYEFDEEEDEPDEYDITFLKIMLLVEQIAGGPIYVGNDVVNPKYPGEYEQDEDDALYFWLPPKLDSLRANWRETAKLETKPAIIF